MSSFDRKRAEKLARAMRELRLRDERRKQSDLGEPGRPGGLIHFIRYYWHILEPNTRLVEGWVLEAICMHLEAVTRGEIKRLLINVFPGAMKSLVVNCFWPAWEWGPAGMPYMRYVTFAYASHLTERDNGRFRDVVRSPEFVEMWGHVFHLTADGVVKPANNHKGWKFSSSIDGVGTGERGNRVLCLPYRERILTSGGWLPIGDVVEGRIPVKIAGLDHASHQIVWQDIEAYERNPGNQVVEIRWEDGFVRCTRDHPVYVPGRGYARADSIKKGDKVVWCRGRLDLPSLPRRDTPQAESQEKILQPAMSHRRGTGIRATTKQYPLQGLRCSRLSHPSTREANSRRCVLQSQVPRGVESWTKESSVSHGQEDLAVQILRGGVREKKWHRRARRMLFKVLRRQVQVGAGAVRSFSLASKAMCPLPQNVSASVPNGEIVLRGMQGGRTFKADAWKRERKICAWRCHAEVSSRLEQAAQGCGSSERWRFLSVMWRWMERSSISPRASRRLRQGQSKPRKPHNSLQAVSWPHARIEEIASDVETKIVCSVATVGREDVVYNVRVGRCHNYFAEGILVHNCDDLHNVREGESEKIRSGTVQWVREGMSNRLNDMERDVIVGICQRVHEDDASAAMLASGDYEHLCIPIEYDPSRHCSTSIGWEDPRTEFGELAWPERFPETVVAQIKRTLGPYAYAAQYQQSPEPRGGGILKRDWWGTYELPVGAPFRHNFEYVVASLDGAYTAREENDPSALVVFGVYYDQGAPHIILLHAWQKWLEIHGQTVKRLPNEDHRSYAKRASPNWGLVEWVTHDCTRLRVNMLLIENKASGHSVAQEITRLYQQKEWQVQLVNPKNLDKRARALAIQHLFADGMIEAPASLHGDVLMYRDWAQMVIDECSKFRGLPGDSDNLVDATTQALKYLRDMGIAIRREERQFIEEEQAMHRPNLKPLY